MPPLDVDQIAEAAGMSRRTFFRYYDSKEELVLERLLESGEAVVEAIRARPADESAWTALRGALDAIVTLQETHAERSRPLQLMLQTETVLRSTVTEQHRRWLEALSPLVGERMPRRRGHRGPDVRAAALTSSALACLEIAQATWAADPSVRLAPLLDELMGAVSPLD
ncbi:TetR family transcriptional regulator [Terrabacter aerolatus]|nr:TetR family transcriptional regulator [Terrabacter aerolatus]